jgi:hypothetical protein
MTTRLPLSDLISSAKFALIHQRIRAFNDGFHISWIAFPNLVKFSLDPSPRPKQELEESSPPLFQESTA